MFCRSEYSIGAKAMTSAYEKPRRPNGKGKSISQGHFRPKQDIKPGAPLQATLTESKLPTIRLSIAQLVSKDKKKTSIEGGTIQGGSDGAKTCHSVSPFQASQAKMRNQTTCAFPEQTETDNGHQAHIHLHASQAKYKAPFQGTLPRQPRGVENPETLVFPTSSG